MQNITRFLFSFQGRLCRSDYWLKGILPLLGISIVMGMIFIPLNHLVPGLSIILGIAQLALFWASCAVGVKRCHDRNRTGWFLLICLIPLVQLWPFFEMAFLKGTDGSNLYGEDSLLSESQENDHSV